MKIQNEKNSKSEQKSAQWEIQQLFLIKELKKIDDSQIKEGIIVEEPFTLEFSDVVKKQYSTENKLNSFSTRWDVVNKTFVRAIKRYYTQEIWSSYKYLNNIESLKSIECWMKIDKVNNFICQN